MAFWTDAYCPTLQCGAFGGPPQPARAMFPPSADGTFGKSVGGILWPWAYVGAGSLWNYNATVDPTSPGFVAAIYKLNDQLAARGTPCVQVTATAPSCLRVESHTFRSMI